MNDTRNELLLLLHLMKSTEDTDLRLSMLLERFEDDLNDQKKHLEYELQDVENNLQTLQYVKTELKDKLGNFYKEGSE